jgi:succinyl-diaminopimelate desuccinylase
MRHLRLDQAGEIQAWLDERAEEMATLLESLVAVDTQNPPGRNLRTAAQVAAEAMQRLGLSPEVINLAPTGALDEPTIVRGAVGSGTRLVYFHGHLDVVPVQDLRQLQPERRAGRITGRGTADMKGGIVSMLYGAAAAREFDLLRDGQIVMHLVCDEETGSAVGSGYLQASNMIDARGLAMLTPEQSGGAIWNAARGALTLRVTLSGREAHVGQASRGVNAFEHMLRVALPIEAFAREMARGNRSTPMAADGVPKAMIVVGGTSGSGASFNVVPGSAWFTIDGRYHPQEDIGSIFVRLREMISETARQVGADVSIEVLQEAQSSFTEPTHPAALLLVQTIGAVEGVVPRFEMCGGALDTRWYADLGIPAFGYGPGRFDVSHGPHECVDEAAVRRCAAVYALYVGQVLSG